MNDAAIVAISAAVPLLTAQFVNLWISSRNNKKINEVQAETKVITGHVNSAASIAATKIEGLEKQISALTLSLAERKETAALLAQSAATTAQGVTKVEVVNSKDDPVPIIGFKASKHSANPIIGKL